MSNTTLFFIESILCTGILYIGFLILSKRSSATFLRFYLMGIIGAAVLFPALQIDSIQKSKLNIIPTRAYEYIEKFENPSREIPDSPEITSEITPETNKIIENKANIFSLQEFIFLGYGVIVVLLFLKLLLSFVNILKLKTGSTIIHSSEWKYYKVEKDKFVAASFFGWIFINNSVSNHDLVNTIYSHETIHKDQWHTIDILVAELFCIVFWLNPIAWIIKKKVRLNTEFDTDQRLVRGLSFSTYSDHLIRLSRNIQNQNIMNYLSAQALKMRIKKMNGKNQQSWVSNPVGISIFAVAFWLVSCNGLINDEFKPIDKFKNVRSITSRFISHQLDTKEKDHKVIATANYNQDGTLGSFTQHMTYPYNLETPRVREFWDEPNEDGILLIMDGLNISHAEKNFLYGNQWPRKYASVSTQRHPLYDDSGFNYETTTNFNMDGFPKEITTTNVGLRGQRFTMEPVTEKFKYQDNNVTSYRMVRKFNLDLIPEEYRKNFVSDSSVITSANFQYIEDKLVGISYKDVQYRFYHEGSKIVRSEFYLNGQLYNYREYFFNDNGFKIRTEIYNVDLQPEYTIFYEYEYY